MKTLAIGPNAVTALGTDTLESLFTIDNCSIVYEAQGQYRSWRPGRDINPFTALAVGSGFIVIMKETLDVTGKFSEGVEGGTSPLVVIFNNSDFDATLTDQDGNPQDILTAVNPVSNYAVLSKTALDAASITGLTVDTGNNVDFFELYFVANSNNPRVNDNDSRTTETNINFANRLQWGSIYLLINDPAPEAWHGYILCDASDYGGTLEFNYLDASNNPISAGTAFPKWPTAPFYGSTYSGSLDHASVTVPAGYKMVHSVQDSSAYSNQITEILAAGTVLNLTQDVLLVTLHYLTLVKL